MPCKHKNELRKTLVGEGNQLTTVVHKGTSIRKGNAFDFMYCPDCNEMWLYIGTKWALIDLEGWWGLTLRSPEFAEGKDGE